MKAQARQTTMQSPEKPARAGLPSATAFLIRLLLLVSVLALFL